MYEDIFESRDVVCWQYYLTVDEKRNRRYVVDNRNKYIYLYGHSFLDMITNK
jgi:hypothetical protein